MVQNSERTSQDITQKGSDKKEINVLKKLKEIALTIILTIWGLLSLALSIWFFIWLFPFLYKLLYGLFSSLDVSNFWIQRIVIFTLGIFGTIIATIATVIIRQKIKQHTLSKKLHILKLEIANLTTLFS